MPTDAQIRTRSSLKLTERFRRYHGVTDFGQKEVAGPVSVNGYVVTDRTAD
jgi:hypothetical protein